MRTKREAKNAWLGFVLGIVAGIFVLVNGVFWLMLNGLISILLPIPVFPFLVLGIIGVLFAAAIFVGAALVYLFKKEYFGGLLILIVSILSMGIGGGFFAGFILGVVGAYFLITKR